MLLLARVDVAAAFASCFFSSPSSTRSSINISSSTSIDKIGCRRRRFRYSNCVVMATPSHLAMSSSQDDTMTFPTMTIDEDRLRI